MVQGSWHCYESNNTAATATRRRRPRQRLGSHLFYDDGRRRQLQQRQEPIQYDGSDDDKATTTTTTTTTTMYRMCKSCGMERGFFITGSNEGNSRWLLYKRRGGERINCTCRPMNYFVLTTMFVKRSTDNRKKLHPGVICLLWSPFWLND